MEFGILGPLLVHDDTRHRVVSGDRQRALLAALLVRHGQPTSTGLLAETVWDGRPPRSALPALRNYVMRLRNTLGPAGERIETTTGGYLIDVRVEELDLARFTMLRDRGLAALRRHDPRRAAELLDDALRLWRGPVLVDIDSDTLRHETAAWLTEARLDVIDARAQARLRLGGDVQPVIAELRSLTAEHPERERLWAHLMTALYRSGRQCEALAVYRRVRQTLVGELGVEPGRELRELHRQMLCGDPALDGPPGSGPEAGPITIGPGGAATQAGAEESDGSRGTAVSTGPVPAGGPTGAPVPDARGVGPAHAAALVTPFQLPPPLPDFTGRAGQLSELVGRLSAADREAPFVAVVSGQPGVGKSTLAVQAAHAARAAFPDGILHAELRAPDGRPVGAAAVLRTFLIALGLPAEQVPDAPADRTALYRSLLAGRRVLVLLEDACDSAQVGPLLPSDPACATLVTSRHRLVDLLGHLPVELDVLTAPEARMLLRRLVGAARPGADPQATARLAAACGNLPLALRICAARLRARPGWDAGHLADRLVGSPRPLDELRVGGLDLRAAIATGYRALDPAAARAFGLLADAAEGPLSAAEAAGVLDLPLPAVEEVLERLVDAHLVAVDGYGRFHYSALMRAFAREQILPPGGPTAPVSQPSPPARRRCSGRRQTAPAGYGPGPGPRPFTTAPASHEGGGGQAPVPSRG